MKYLLTLALLSGLSYAGQEPVEDEQVYLYSFIKGERGAIKHYREEMPDRVTCLERKDEILVGPHNRDSWFCGGDIEGYENTPWSIDPKGRPR
jgi:hypothetical protein